MVVTLGNSREFNESAAPVENMTDQIKFHLKWRNIYFPKIFSFDFFKAYDLHSIASATAKIADTYVSNIFKTLIPLRFTDGGCLRFWTTSMGR